MHETKEQRIKKFKESWAEKRAPPKTPQEREEKNKNVVQEAFFETDDYLYEQVVGPGFACYNRKTGDITYVPKVELLDGVLVPMNPLAVDTGLVTLPDSAESYGTELELFEEIKQFIHDYLDISDEMLQFASYYVLLSWVYDRMNTICYLRALGDTGSGKTRYLDTIGRLCYKAMFLSGAATAAPMFRIIERWKGTLVVDEADFARSDTFADVIKILNTGFEKGKPVIRCSKEDPNEIEIHRVYCPKVLSSRYTYEDKALESRCLTEVMSQTNRDIPLNLGPDFYKRSNDLRNKLLMYRFLNYDRIMNDGYELKMEGIEPRLRQATHSFTLLFKKDKVMEQIFVDFIHRYQKELIEERAGSLEGRVALAINYFMEQGEDWIYSAKLCEFINDGIGNPKDKITNGKVGRILKSFGLTTKQKRVGDKNIRAIDLDEKKLDRIFHRYVPGFVAHVADVADIADTPSPLQSTLL